MDNAPADLAIARRREHRRRHLTSAELCFACAFARSEAQRECHRLRHVATDRPAGQRTAPRRALSRLGIAASHKLRSARLSRIATSPRRRPRPSTRRRVLGITQACQVERDLDRRPSGHSWATASRTRHARPAGRRDSKRDARTRPAAARGCCARRACARARCLPRPGRAPASVGVNSSSQATCFKSNLARHLGLRAGALTRRDDRAREGRRRREERRHEARRKPGVREPIRR